MPKEKEPTLSKEHTDKFKEIAKSMRHNPAYRLAGNMFFTMIMIYYHSATKEGRHLLTKPEYRKMLLDREKRSGLLEDTILSPVLFHPNDEGLSLSKSHAPAGRWISFDFRRPKEFYPKKVQQKDQGRLMTFALPEVMENDKEMFTPTYLLNIYEITHFLTVETPSITDLLEYGFVRETSYREAFSRAGVYDSYSKYLTLGKLNDQPIYQITPKGNGLVFLATDTGPSGEEKDLVRKLVPSWSNPL